MLDRNVHQVQIEDKFIPLALRRNLTTVSQCIAGIVPFASSSPRHQPQKCFAFDPSKGKRRRNCSKCESWLKWECCCLLLACCPHKTQAECESNAVWLNRHSERTNPNRTKWADKWLSHLKQNASNFLFQWNKMKLKQDSIANRNGISIGFVCVVRGGGNFNRFYNSRLDIVRKKSCEEKVCRSPPKHRSLVNCLASLFEMFFVSLLQTSRAIKRIVWLARRIFIAKCLKLYLNLSLEFHDKLENFLTARLPMFRTSERKLFQMTEKLLFAKKVITKSA